MSCLLNIRPCGQINNSGKPLGRRKADDPDHKPSQYERCAERLCRESCQAAGRFATAPGTRPMYTRCPTTVSWTPGCQASASGLIDWNDDKLREAAELVIAEGQGSVSRFQRRLGVGHARAGKLMDSLEALGIVGTHVGSKPREVLVSLEELPNILGSS